MDANTRNGYFCVTKFAYSIDFLNLETFLVRVIIVAVVLLVDAPKRWEKS